MNPELKKIGIENKPAIEKIIDKIKFGNRFKKSEITNLKERIVDNIIDGNSFALIYVSDIDSFHEKNDTTAVVNTLDWATSKEKYVFWKEIHDRCSNFKQN